MEIASNADGAGAAATPVGAHLRRERLEGAALGVALTALVATLGTLLGARWSLGFLDLSFLAIAVAAYVGWTGAEDCAVGDAPLWVAARQGVRASGWGVIAFVLIALGAGLLGAILDDSGSTFGSGTVMPLVLVAYLVLVAAYGFVFSLPVTLPIAFVATAVMRLGRRWPLGPPVVIVGAAILAAALALAAIEP